MLVKVKFLIMRWDKNIDKYYFRTIQMPQKLGNKLILKFKESGRFKIDSNIFWFHSVRIEFHNYYELEFQLNFLHLES